MLGKPYSDPYMRYDLPSHRYVLTSDYVLEKMNRNLSEILAENGSYADKANEAEILLDRVSMLVYDFVYMTTLTPLKKERELALNKRHRNTLMLAMREQLVYLLTNGDVSQFSSVNVDNGAIIDPYAMRQATIAPTAKEILVVGGVVSYAASVGQRDIEPSYDEEEY